MLEATDLSYRYASKTAVSQLQLSQSSPGIVAFLGHNGAGKTTTLKLLSGLMKPSTGTVRVLGEDPLTSPNTRGKIGYLPEIAALYPDYQVREQLQFAASLHGYSGAKAQQLIDKVTEQCDIGKLIPRLQSKLSKGQQQRVALAQALVHQPELILLDEPGTGMDPVERQRLAQILRQVAENAVVVYSTHHLGDALTLADKLWVIAHGNQCFFGPAEELTHTEPTTEVVFKPNQDMSKLERLPSARVHRQISDYHFQFQTETELLAELVNAKLEIERYQPVQSDLERQLLNWLTEPENP